MRIISVANAVAIIAVGSACQGTPKPIQTKSQAVDDSVDPRTRSPFKLDSGHTIARGESRYAVIRNNACPGVRVANTRFQAAQDLVVRMTEDNTTLECTEGTVTRPLVIVYHADNPAAKPDTIPSYGIALSIVGGNTGPDAERSVPLLDDFEQGDGQSPGAHVYRSLLTGKQLFVSESPILTFVANGTRRYVAVQGGNKDTVATVAYGSGVGPPQVIHITPSAGDTIYVDALFAIDTDSLSLDGPRKNGAINFGNAIGKDTVPVSGVTLRFRIEDVSMSVSADNKPRSYVLKIENDRLLLVSPRQ